MMLINTYFHRFNRSSSDFEAVKKFVVGPEEKFFVRLQVFVVSAGQSLQNATESK